MATSFTKTYQITCTFKMDDGSDLADSDLNPSILREEIIGRIEQACRVSKGVLQSRPSSVTES